MSCWRLCIGVFAIFDRLFLFNDDFLLLFLGNWLLWRGWSSVQGVQALSSSAKVASWSLHSITRRVVLSVCAAVSHPSLLFFLR